VTKSQLADFVYGVGADVDEKVVEVYVSRLRKKLADFNVMIRSARGLGYTMDLPK
jgi:two-component system OmpR family response regulator